MTGIEWRYEKVSPGCIRVALPLERNGVCQEVEWLKH